MCKIIPRYKYVIIGAGVSGLVTASKLMTQNSKDILILEQEDHVGGLCRTIKKEMAAYDLGSHRLHTSMSKKSKAYLDNIFKKEQLIKNRRYSKLFLRKHYIDYPLQLVNVLKGIGLLESILCFLSYLTAKLKSLFIKAQASYEKNLITSVGARFYHLFYRPYAIKVWGIRPDLISESAIKKRMATTNPLKLVASMLFQLSRQLSYYYLKGGIGNIPESIEQSIKGNVHIIKGVRDFNFIALDSPQKKLTFYDATTKEQRCVEFENIISTIPIPKIIQKLSGQEISHAVSSLVWTGLRLVFLHIKGHPQVYGETFYFPELEYTFGRVSIPKVFDPNMQKEDDYTVFICEVPYLAGDKISTIADMDLIDKCYNDLLKTKLTAGKLCDQFNFCKKLPFVYPIYIKSWEEHLQNVLDWISKHYPYIYLSGRMGLFLHCNIDQTMEVGLELAETLLAQKPSYIWHKQSRAFHNFKLRD